MRSYINQALVPGEEIVANTHFHWTNWVWPVLMFLLPVVLYAASLVYVGANTRVWLNYVLWALIAAGLFYFLWELIRIRATEIAVTDRRFIRKTGWIAHETSEIELRSIEEVGLKQSVLGRIFGYGDMTIRGTGAGLIVMEGIDAPKSLQKSIQTAQEKLRQRSGQSGAPAGGLPQS
jgi:uncharacterized membrane protein YdbT with pleckstrin-like domain